LRDLDIPLGEAVERSPIGERIDIADVGLTAAFPTTPFAARLTGGTVHVDGGRGIMARRPKRREAAPWLCCTSNWFRLSGVSLPARSAPCSFRASRGI
ncbi:hypothetical protein ACFPYM_11590, partial [Methylobacterium hispanicum]